MGNIDKTVMFNISYGLFVLSAYDKEQNKDNGCIINTVNQVTDSPKRIAVAVNKANYTCDMIKKTGEFNISILSTKADFELFKRFGFQSGKDTDKFAGFDSVKRSENGVLYLTKAVNSYISAKVTGEIDCDTHVLFIAEVTEGTKLNDDQSLTYDYYGKNIKPKPEPKEQKKKGYICKICGYVYEGDELPADFICPICKHSVDDFEKIV